jgi:very-short-patch-repair endonuclease
MASGVVGIQRVSEEKLHDARELRKNMTEAEALLWDRLRGRKCGKLKFRRQQIIEGFIADFYCELSQLVVEVDGGIHNDSIVKKNDVHREEVFKARGIRTIRFRNDEIINNAESVLVQIADACKMFNKHSKLADWENRRLKNSASPLASGEDSGLNNNDFTPLASGEGKGVRS